MLPGEAHQWQCRRPHVFASGWDVLKSKMTRHLDVTSRRLSPAVPIQMTHELKGPQPTNETQQGPSEHCDPSQFVIRVYGTVCGLKRTSSCAVFHPHAHAHTHTRVILTPSHPKSSFVTAYKESFLVSRKTNNMGAKVSTTPANEKRFFSAR